VGGVILTISLSRVLHFSTVLTLLTMGVATRNLDRNRYILEIDFGWIARLFFILLFVSTGIHLNLAGLWQASFFVLAFLFVRTIAKFMGISLFSKSCQLTYQQTFALSFALTPMSSIAISMSHTLCDFNPALGYTFHLAVVASLTLLDVVGPFATQLAFIKTGEAHADTTRL
jgi:Kef-type K+ transport system membrane component KefB